MSYLFSENTDFFGELIYKSFSKTDIDYNVAGASGSLDPHTSWGARLGARYRF